MLTKKMKGWLIEQKYAAEAASDTEFLGAMTKAITEGKLDAAKIAELTAPDEPDPKDELGDAVAKAVEKAMAPLVEKMAKTEKKVSLADEIDGAVTKAMSGIMERVKPDSQHTPAQVLAGTSEGEKTQARVKSPVESYSSSRTHLCYPMDTKHVHLRGQPAFLPGQERIPLESSSERDRAISGAYFKFACAAGCNGRLPRWLQMTEHDKQLLDYALHEEKWSGVAAGEKYEIDGRKLFDFERKALLDDSTSGGLEAAPIVFDNAVITIPVLYGQLFPLVETQTLTRGRRVEGFSIGNVTVTSGTAEGTAISLFDTTTFIAAFDTTIYNAVAAIQIGNDFQEDSPVNIAAIITQKLGEKYQEWLDNQIANGDGTTEPQGLVNATSGMTDIGNPAGGANAAPQVVDFEKLYFGVTLPYRTPLNRCRFVMNDTSYQRAVSIAEASGWQTRAFGMRWSSYELADGSAVAIQNDMANTVAFFCNLSRYRMYRRLGMNVRVETAGDTLARANLTEIITRARWGGKLTSGSAAAYSDNWQT